MSFFFQAEDGIRYLVRSRGLGDVYKRQALQVKYAYAVTAHKAQGGQWNTVFVDQGYVTEDLSLIHI